VRAVDGRELITTQRLLKYEPKDEGSGSQILVSVDDTNSAVDALANPLIQIGWVEQD
jgi:hypothetical protein